MYMSMPFAVLFATSYVFIYMQYATYIEILFTPCTEPMLLQYSKELIFHYRNITELTNMKWAEIFLQINGLLFTKYLYNQIWTLSDSLPFIICYRSNDLLWWFIVSKNNLMPYKNQW